MQNIFYKMLEDESDDESQENTNICLISHEKLSQDHVILLCNHKFNYKHIYDEVFSQKYKINNNEIQKLSKYQFKCPYCRKIQNGVLPSNPDFQSINGVNSPDNMVIKTNNCSYIFASGKRKAQLCSKKCYKNYCNQHQKIMDKKLCNVKSIIKCCATTKKGTPCTRKVKNSIDKYCSQHKKLNNTTPSNTTINITV